jgi:hypothetical protein
MVPPMHALALALLLAAAPSVADDAPASPPPSAACTALDLSLPGLGSAADDLGRVAELAGLAPPTPRLLRRASGERLVLCPPGTPSEARPSPWTADGPRPAAPAWQVVPPTSFSKLHTGWSDDRNDGALFAGRGLSTELSAGVRLDWRWLSGQLAPLAAWQQNRAFPVPASTAPGTSPYANPFNGGNIDLPLRFGPSDFWTFDWGQSFLRADAFGVAAGISTENLWWGPGVRDSLLMSNSAAGIPHLFLGTSRPLDVWIGHAQLELLWGLLGESRWFDRDPSNDRRLFEAVVVGYSPRFVPGLHLSFARVFLFPTDKVATHHYFDPILQPLFKSFLKKSATDDGSSPDNQLTSVTLRWAFPESQLELWGEFARDDHAFNLIDLLQEPAHSAAWLFGLQKLFPAGRGLLRLHLELAHTFEMPPSHPTRPVPTFYTHIPERQGYTQRGQMLGAGLGPQGDSQELTADWFVGAGRVGGRLLRVVRNERWFYDQIVPAVAKPRHDAQIGLTLRGAWSWPEWDVEGELGGSHRYAPGFEPSAGEVEALLRVSWWPGRAAPLALPLR